jgi:hypothetical protein
MQKIIKKSEKNEKNVKKLLHINEKCAIIFSYICIWA